MQLHIKLVPGRDDALIAAVQAISPGKRAERIREVLTQGLVGGPDLAAAVHRLAAAIEQWPRAQGPPGQDPASTAPPAPLTERMAADPDFAEQVRTTLLGAWE